MLLSIYQFYRTYNSKIKDKRIVWFNTKSLPISLLLKQLMQTSKYSFLFVVGTLLSFSASVMAEDFKDFAELDLEALLNTEVVSASKKAQKISESPNAISVITAEDIRYSGAVDLPDLFRMVPGIDVGGVDGSAYAVSSRGFNDRFAQRMLVMIDGRSIYATFFGGVFWEIEEVFLEDVERIDDDYGRA